MLKKNFLALSMFALTSLLVNVAYGENASLKFDVDKSSIKWVGSKVSGSHNGTVKLKDGSLKLDKKSPEGSFTIDMNSINNLDLSGEWKGKLEGHLKSDDFFSVAKFPTSTFKLKKLDDLGSGKYKFYGDMTIKGISKPIEFPVEISAAKNKTTLTSKFKINRLDWDIRYNSKEFFDVKKLGDKMIYNDIEIELSLETL